MLKKYGDQRFHRSPNWISDRGRTAERPRLCLAEHRDSKRRIHHLRKNIAVEKALAPSGVQVRKRFARRYFGGRFAGGLQFLNTIARPTSMSRNLVRSALLPSGPCPGTILVLLSAKGRT